MRIPSLLINVLLVTYSVAPALAYPTPPIEYGDSRYTSAAQNPYQRLHRRTSFTAATAAKEVGESYRKYAQKFHITPKTYELLATFITTGLVGGAVWSALYDPLSRIAGIKKPEPEEASTPAVAQASAGAANVASGRQVDQEKLPQTPPVSLDGGYPTRTAGSRIRRAILAQDMRLTSGIDSRSPLLRPRSFKTSTISFIPLIKLKIANVSFKKFIAHAYKNLAYGALGAIVFGGLMGLFSQGKGGETAALPPAVAPQNNIQSDDPEPKLPENNAKVLDEVSTIQERPLPSDMKHRDNLTGPATAGDRLTTAVSVNERSSGLGRRGMASRLLSGNLKAAWLGLLFTVGTVGAYVALKGTLWEDHIQMMKRHEAPPPTTPHPAPKKRWFLAAVEGLASFAIPTATSFAGSDLYERFTKNQNRVAKPKTAGDQAKPAPHSAVNPPDVPKAEKLSQRSLKELD